VNQIPHTSKNARVTSYQVAHDVFAIEVKNATYRGTTFSGIIELVNGSDSIRKYKGAYRANAKLSWFGVTLKKRSPFINLNGAKVTLLPCYSGQVVSCLG
jgi:hypothetical protein